MRKTLYLFIPLVVVVGIIFYSREKVTANPATPAPTVLGAPSTRTESAWIGPFDSSQVTLYSNLTEKLTARELYKKYSCKALVNAGFYTKEMTPVGYFKTKTELIRSQNKNSLFNSFFTVNQMLTPRLTRELPEGTLWGLQVGPLLFENGSPVDISMVRDEEARRVFLGVTGDNKIIFGIFYDKESNFNGPTLESLPEKIQKLSSETGVLIADAVNLDGGSASAFITESIQLTELSPIGSFFCVK